MAYVELMGEGTYKCAELPLRANDFIQPEACRHKEDIAKFSGLLLACATGYKNTPANLDNDDG